jgi:transcription antitermination factor NusB
VKGRRRARRAALQALYELDQSRHELEDVVRGRLRDMHVAAGAGALAPTGRRLLESLLRDHSEEDLPRFAAAALEERYGADPETALDVVDLIEQVRPHAAYAVAIVRGVTADRAPIDEVISRIAPEWPVEQMAPIDRNVLRIALWEIGTGSSPIRVAINEAVELARAFSGEGSRRMVNGALGAYTSGDPKLHLEPRHEGSATT